MTTPLLAYMPVRDSYTFTPAYNTVEVRLNGGRSRKRLDFLGGVHTVTPTWILNKTDYTIFMGFFRERVQQGSRMFRCQLLSDVGVVMPHLCTCKSGLPQLSQQSGDGYYVTATLEVIPNPCKAFSVEFQNAAGVGRVLDTGSADYAGDISEFPLFRFVLITGTKQTQAGWAGVSINLDGTYQINTISSATTFDLLNPFAVNSDWTVLGTLSPTNTVPGIGACILIPE